MGRHRADVQPVTTQCRCQFVVPHGTALPGKAVPIQANQCVQADLIERTQPVGLCLVDKHPQRFVGDEGGVQVETRRPMPKESKV